MDSNHRPRAYQARALTTWATNRYSCVLILPIFPPVCSLLLFLLSSLSEKWRVKSEEWRDAFKQAWTLGGDDGIRTHDPLLAGQVLSQLSYTPIPRALSFSKTMPVPENWTTKDWYLAFCVPTSSTRMTGSWHPVPVSIERRWSSRTFRYGYLVTT